MRFLKRGDDKKPEQAVPGWPTEAQAEQTAPPPVAAVPPPVVREPERTGPVTKTSKGWDIHVTTAVEAKEAIAYLKEQKRDLQALKKEVSAEHAEVRAEHAERRAGRNVLPRGGGRFGQVARYAVQSNRRNERMQMQNQSQAFNDRKQAIDGQIRQLDGVVLQLQRFIAENAPAPKARTSVIKPAPAADVTERMKALNDLRDAGLVTEAEYAEKRADLLARL